MIQHSFSFDSVMLEKQIAIARQMRELDQAKHDRINNGGASVVTGLVDFGCYAFDMPYECTSVVGALALFFGAQSLKCHMQVCAKKNILDMLRKTN
jgi:hypothetical protein